MPRGRSLCRSSCGPARAGPRPSGRFNGYWNQTVRIAESSSPRREDWLGQADTRLFNPGEGYLGLGSAPATGAVFRALAENPGTLGSFHSL